MEELKYRQVHLDFHTSELIKGVGSGFDKAEFQNALKEGHIDSITLFSKCHHGYAYHPTKVHEMHPGLKFDLLRAQIEACREIGVRTPIYISAGLDEKEAIRHPEWLARNEDESTTWVPDFVTKPGYHLHCFNTEYLDLLLEQIKEVMENYQPEAVFLDIASVHPCYCSKCRTDILARGKDLRDYDAVMEQAEIVYKKYANAVRSTINEYNPNCRIFHNGGHITRGRRDLAYYNTHLELESLPTGGWGYDHFPMSASYVCNLNMDYLGMTGKFHNSWGEFGGFKHPNALCYETSQALAFGAKCSIGDQLHPTGKMDINTYRLIGSAYKEVEKKEVWCENSVGIADIGILSDEAVNMKISSRDMEAYADVGANRMMLEGKYLYHFLDLNQDFKAYKLIILPDNIRISDELKEKLDYYMAHGGRVLATGRSGLAERGDYFAIDLGIEYIKENENKPNYIVPEFSFVTGKTPHVMYEGSYEIRRLNGEIVANSLDSYFNRELNQFCSHRHSPYGCGDLKTAVVVNEKTAYIGFNVFTDYGKMGSLHLKELVCYVIERLLGKEKTITTDLPDRGIVTLRKQKKENRYVCHLLFAHTTNRGVFDLEGQQKNIEVIEDVVPLYQKKVTVRVPEHIKSVMLVPQMQALQFEMKNDEVQFVVPEMSIHQMIELAF